MFNYWQMHLTKNPEGMLCGEDRRQAMFDSEVEELGDKEEGVRKVVEPRDEEEGVRKEEVVVVAASSSDFSTASEDQAALDHDAGSNIQSYVTARSKITDRQLEEGMAGEAGVSASALAVNASEGRLASPADVTIEEESTSETTSSGTDDGATKL